MKKINHHYVMQYFYMKDLSPINIKAELGSPLGESAQPFTTVKRCVAEFKRDRTTCQGEQRNGWPNEVMTPEMVQKIQKRYWIIIDWKCTSRHSRHLKNAIYSNLSGNWYMRKLRARWMPQFLTLEHKQGRKDVSIQCLAKFHTHGSTTLHPRQKNNQAQPAPKRGRANQFLL